jgi:cobalt/nickel transport system permease protein
MHISEGVLSAPVLITGAVLSAAGVAVGLRKMSYDKIPQVAVLSSAFFVASLIHVPIGPSAAHLVLNGLLGILLGWMAFPSILVALSLQALLFQFGGLTVLGVNTFIMGAPAMIAFLMCRPFVFKDNSTLVAAGGFLAGTIGIAAGAFIVAFTLISTGESFQTVAKVILITHVPVMVIEGIVTAFCVLFLKKVKPEILEVSE